MELLLRGEAGEVPVVNLKLQNLNIVVVRYWEGRHGSISFRRLEKRRVGLGVSEFVVKEDY